jgi:hypothetical protein
MSDLEDCNFKTLVVYQVDDPVPTLPDSITIDVSRKLLCTLRAGI